MLFNHLSKFILITLISILLISCGSGGSPNQTSPEVVTPHSSYSLSLNLSDLTNENSVKILPIEETCIEDCIKNFNLNSTVTLVALPTENSVFTGWEGHCEQVFDCQITLDKDKKVTAKFHAKSDTKYTVEIQSNSGGIIYINNEWLECNTLCVRTFSENEAVLLFAQSNDGFQFDGWSGDCTSDKFCFFSINKDLSLNANFSTSTSVVTKQLAINFSGEGVGKVTALELDRECFSSCIIDIPIGTSVELIAEATSSESQFDNWGGACSGNATCIVDMGDNSEVNVNFSSDSQYALTLNIDGDGQVKINEMDITCASQCQYPVKQGDTLSFTPIATEGYQFDQWGGDCQGSTCSITVENDVSISANFPPSVFNKNTNSILITEPHGIEHVNYPIQIARPFVKGEITGYPQAIINGTPIQTQANIKQRHSDGSVKHAIISFVLDSLPAYGIATVEFTDGEESSIPAITTEEILSDSMQFDAKVEYRFSDDKTSIVSAREMFINGHIETWLEGPVVSTYLIADHSVNRVYDLGNDEKRSIRPLFYVTFWKALNQYSVRFISENTNTEYLQDQEYDLSLYLKYAQAPIYQQENIFHQARTSWSKLYQSNELEILSIDHNLQYLIKTRSVPNFDTQRTVEESHISQLWESWLNADKNLYDRGLWQPAMPNTGGRADIGLYPSWVVKWLFTGDWRLKEIAFTQAELAGAWPIYYREGDTAKTFDFDQQISGVGKILSIAPGARPSQWTRRPEWPEVKAEDIIIMHGGETQTQWRPDSAHHPDLSSLQYLLSGDYFFLEQMLFSTAYLIGDSNAKATKFSYGRGPTGSEGAMYAGQTRSQAWHLRSRVHTYDILPDDFVEKAYLNTLMRNAISLWEGKYLLTNSYSEKNDLHQFAIDHISASAFGADKAPSQLGQWEIGTTAGSYVNANFVDTGVIKRAAAPWMQNMLIVSLGRAKELGWETDNLLQYASKPIRDIFTVSDINHHMMFAYVVPTLGHDNKWQVDWEALFDTYNPDYVQQVRQTLINGRDTEHGYYSIGMAAAAYSQTYSNGDLLWQYILTNVASKSVYDTNPKWAILPLEENE